jgi:hypothetical protein
MQWNAAREIYKNNVKRWALQNCDFSWPYRASNAFADPCHHENDA